MKKFGLIGGTSWHSTMVYYSKINRTINEFYGNNTNPPIQLVSLNQKEIHDLQRQGDWEGIATIFLEAAKTLENSGVEGIAICANTPHKIYSYLVANLTVPVLHIADSIAVKIKKEQWSKVGLLGTAFTMKEEFIKGYLHQRHNIDTIVPDLPTQDKIQQLIYNQFSVGIFEQEAKQFFRNTIDLLAKSGGQAVILGCTEFPLLLKDTHCEIPLIDSLECHCQMIVDFILDY